MFFKFLVLAPFIVFSVILLKGCSGGQLLSAISITSAKCVARDVIYEPNKMLTADIYYTNTANSVGNSAKSTCENNSHNLGLSTSKQEPLIRPPTLIFIFGGGWQKGDKTEYGFVADAFIKQGYNVVIAN